MGTEVAEVAGDGPLEYEHTSHVLLRDVYGWVDLSLFSFRTGPQVSPLDVVSWLLADGHYYQDRYNVADNHPTRESRAVVAERGRERWRRDIAANPSIAPPPGLLAHLDGPYEPPTGPALHGPYFMSAITVDAFDLLDGAGARDVLVDWLETSSDPPAREIEGDLDAIVDHLAGAPVVFRLRDLGEEFVHDAGFVVDPFIELITVDTTAGRLGLVAGGGD